MSENLFKLVKASNHQFDKAVPAWLKAEEEPEFKFSEYGDADTNLLLLHGLLGAMTNWDDAIPYFQKYAKTTAFRFPLLTAKRAEVKIKSLAAYTEYFIRKSQMKQPLTICGNSLGGHVALRVALAAPELVSGLVLAGSSGLYEHTIDTLPIRPNREFVRSQMTRVFYDDKFITEEGLGEVADILKVRAHHLNIIHAARSAKKDYLLEYLPQVKVPVLLVWGEDDLVTTMDVAETFRDNLPNSKLVTFEKCGHAPMIEHPEKFSDAVKEFLADNNLLGA